MEVLLVIGAIWLLFIVVAKVSSWADKAGQFDKLSPKITNLEYHEKKLKSGKEQFEKDRESIESAWNSKVARDSEAIDKLFKQRSMGFPWLASAYADYIELEEQKRISALKYKKRPAPKAAEEVRVAKNLRKDAEQRYRIAKYIREYYEGMFPWLIELVADSEEEQILASVNEYENGESDRAKKWLTPEEYQTLSSSQKYQLALDRYVSRKKSRWEIGREYERYVGYLWEKEGFAVSYFGIMKGFEDLGRDLVAIKNGEVNVIQCKCWSSQKTIHEKHIFQLFGTTVEYWMNNHQYFGEKPTISELAAKISEKAIVPVFVTSTCLSSVALSMAETLKVSVFQEEKLVDYPRIKCNISGRDGEKIYHLPFDQQYDRIVIEPDKGEFYAGAVEEAESAGFRRAFRWRGNGSQA